MLFASLPPPRAALRSVHPQGCYGSGVCLGRSAALGDHLVMASIALVTLPRHHNSGSTVLTPGTPTLRPILAGSQVWLDFIFSFCAADRDR